MADDEIKKFGIDAEEKPPILSSWKQVYAVVFLNLVLLVILFYLFAKFFG
jgi:hypothetical protein